MNLYKIKDIMKKKNLLFLLLFIFIFLLCPKIVKAVCTGTIESCPEYESGCTACSNCCSWIDNYCLGTPSCPCAGMSQDDCNNCPWCSWDEGPDTEPPKYYDNSTNSTAAGTPVKFNLRWTDVSLSHAVLSIWNGTTPWVNITPWCSLSGTSDWCNVTTPVNLTPGVTIWWRQYANDSASPSNWNTSENFSFVTTEELQYSLNSTNSTARGEPTEFRLKWTTNTGLSGYIFSFDNCTGSFQNYSWTSFPTGGTEDWSNVTKTISSTGGCTTRWKVYANATYGKWEASSVYSFNTSKKSDGLSCTANTECIGGYCVHNICRSTSTYCGDGYCDSGESCDVCVADCGICPGDGEAPSPPVEIPPPEEPTEFPEAIIELPDLPPAETPITMPETGLTIKLEPNFLITLYPLTNLTAVVHNLTKIEEPSKYKILLCNQTLISSYEINITVDLAYFCANYSGYHVEDPTVNIFKFEENDWIPLKTEDIEKDINKKIVCGKLSFTPYMVTGLTSTIDSQTALVAITASNNSITIAREQGIDVSKAEELIQNALFEYYSCNYVKAKQLAEKALESLVIVPPWLIPASFAVIAVVAIAWFWYYTVKIKVKVKR